MEGELHDQEDRYDDLPRIIRREADALADADGTSTEALLQMGEEEFLASIYMDGGGPRKAIGRAVWRMRKRATAAFPLSAQDRQMNA